MKRKIALILALVMAVAVFAGCGESKKTSVSGDASFEGDVRGLKLPIESDGQEIRMVGISAVDTPDDCYAFTRMREITGLNIKIELYPDTGWKQKLQIFLAGKQLPDFIGQLAMMEPGQITDYGKQGAFANVVEYADDEHPNLKYLLEQNKDYVAMFGSEDGELFGVPGGAGVSGNDFTHGFIYRKDIFEKHGLKLWKNADEAYEVMKELKKLYPESYPMTNKYGTFFFYNMAEQWGMNNNNIFYDEKDNTWKFSNTQDKYREMLDYFKKLYSEGLLDPEFATRTLADYTARLSRNSEHFIAFDWVERSTILNDTSTVEGFDFDIAWPIGPDGARLNKKVGGPGSAVAKNKNTDVTMKLVDFILSPFGVQLMSIGEEGKTFTTQEDGSIKYIGFEDGENIVNTDLMEKYGLLVQGVCGGYDKRALPCTTKTEIEASELWKDVGNPIDPTVSLTADESKEAAAILAKLENPGYEFAFKYVIGQTATDKDWENWKKQAERLGSKKLEEIYNAAQKRLDARKK